MGISLSTAVTSLIVYGIVITLCIAGENNLPVNESPNQELIPRSVLFGNPEKASPRISPDGKRLAYRAPVDGVMNVWVAPIDNIQDAKAVTRDKTTGISQYFWAKTGNHILVPPGQQR